MYTLDTNVASEVRRRSPQAVKWIRGIQPDTLFPSAIAIGEIMRGVMLKARSDPRAAATLNRQDAVCASSMPPASRRLTKRSQPHGDG